MELSRETYRKIDVITKLVGLVLAAIGINYLLKANFLLAVFYLSAGILISLTIFFVKVKVK